MGAWKLGFKKAQVNLSRSWVLKWVELTWLGIGVLNDFANGFSIWGSLATQIYAYLICRICQVPIIILIFVHTNSFYGINYNQPYVDRPTVKGDMCNGKLYRIGKLSPHGPDRGHTATRRACALASKTKAKVTSHLKDKDQMSVPVVTQQLLC